ncbi:hypothetical protein EDB89DRAFT_1945277, partial [Lactarius sanguifluus]
FVCSLRVFLLRSPPAWPGFCADKKSLIGNLNEAREINQANRAPPIRVGRASCKYPFQLRLSLADFERQCVHWWVTFLPSCLAPPRDRMNVGRFVTPLSLVRLHYLRKGIVEPRDKDHLEVRLLCSGRHGVRPPDMSPALRTMQTITQRAESDWILPAGSTSFQTYETSEEHNSPLQNVVSSIDLHAVLYVLEACPRLIGDTHRLGK